MKNQNTIYDKNLNFKKTTEPMHKRFKRKQLSRCIRDLKENNRADA